MEDAAPDPTRIIAIRHGETDWNAAARIQGHTDIALNARGLEQARLAAAALAGDPVAAVYASDLQRAWQTAEAIAAHHALPVQRDPALRERRFGAFEGHSFAALEPLHPELCSRWRHRDPDFAAPGGETLRDFAARAQAALLRIAARHPGQLIVVAVHGGVLDAFYRAATGQDLQAPRSFELRNAAFNRLLYAQGRLSLIGWADTAHLEAALNEDVA
jgi:probable phosphoglycerate mutase